MTIALATAAGSAPPPAILRCAAELGAALERVRDASAVYLTTPEKAAALEALVAVESQVRELRLRVMAAAGDVADETGAHDVAAWLASTTRVRFADARADQRLAAALDDRHAAVAAAMRAGTVNIAQAEIITRTLDTLAQHGEVSAEVLEQAEGHLVDQAAHFGPRALRRLARHVLDVIAPDVAEAAEARRLAALEAGARTRTRLTLRRTGDGTTRISGLLPDAAATRLATYLEALTSPRVAASAPELPGLFMRLPHPRRLGEAFLQFLETIDPKRLPIHGGDATTLMVTIGLDSLRSELGTGDILGTGQIPGGAEGEFGEQLSAADVRRLACTAQIVPTVLGTDSEILDLGRSARLFSRAQRRAMLLRDHTCRAEGCDIPGTWAEAHHLHPWSRGGSTDLADGVLLCSRDHHRAHDPAHRTELLSNGDLRFHRRT